MDNICFLFLFSAKQRIRVRVSNWGRRRRVKKSVLPLKPPNWNFRYLYKRPLSIGPNSTKIETTGFVGVQLKLEGLNRDSSETTGTISIIFPKIKF